VVVERLWPPSTAVLLLSLLIDVVVVDKDDGQMAIGYDSFPLIWPAHFGGVSSVLVVQFKMTSTIYNLDWNARLLTESTFLFTVYV
jgi:hypothetical protein